jgi:hypothetical protein
MRFGFDQSFVGLTALAVASTGVIGDRTYSVGVMS